MLLVDHMISQAADVCWSEFEQCHHFEARGPCGDIVRIRRRCSGTYSIHVSICQVIIVRCRRIANFRDGCQYTRLNMTCKLRRWGEDFAATRSDHIAVLNGMRCGTTGSWRHPSLILRGFPRVRHKRFLVCGHGFFSLVRSLSVAEATLRA